MRKTMMMLAAGAAFATAHRRLIGAIHLLDAVATQGVLNPMVAFHEAVELKIEAERRR
jgi:hypothetical protein